MRRNNKRIFTIIIDLNSYSIFPFLIYEGAYLSIYARIGALSQGAIRPVYSLTLERMCARILLSVVRVVRRKICSGGELRALGRRKMAAGGGCSGGWNGRRGLVAATPRVTPRAR